MMIEKLDASERRALEDAGYTEDDQLLDAASKGVNFKEIDRIGELTHRRIYEFADSEGVDVTLETIAQNVRGGERFRRAARERGLHEKGEILDYYMSPGNPPLHTLVDGFGAVAEVEVLRFVYELIDDVE